MWLNQKIELKRMCLIQLLVKKEVAFNIDDVGMKSEANTADLTSIDLKVDSQIVLKTYSNNYDVALYLIFREAKKYQNLHKIKAFINDQEIYKSNLYEDSTYDYQQLHKSNSKNNNSNLSLKQEVKR